MGLKIKVPKIKNLVRDVARVNLALPTMGMSEAAFNKGPKPPSPGEDPQVTALRSRLYGEADQFNKDLGSMKADERNLIQQEGNRALDSGLRKTRESYNRRGLLYSGLRQGGEQDLRGRVASQVASSTAQANKNLDDLAQGKMQTAASVGLQSFADMQRRQGEIESARMSSQIARQQAFQQLGGAAGQMGGYAYGMGNRQPQTQSNEVVLTNERYNPRGFLTA